MQEIVDSVKRVTGIMSEITAASSEQTDGIEQINQAITPMDQVTQQNAALVEQAAATAESLQIQAANLSQVVGVFNIGGLPSAPLPSEPNGLRRTTTFPSLPRPQKSAIAGIEKPAPTQRSDRPHRASIDAARTKVTVTTAGDNWGEF